MAKATAERVRKTAPPPEPPPESEELGAGPGANGPVQLNGVTPPPKTPEDQDPFLFMQQFTADDWRLMTGYLYRTEPFTNRRGRDSNIELFVNPFDASDVMKKHGSGGYRCDLNVDRPEGGGRKRLRQFYFDIMNPDYPPRIPPGDWVDDPRNVKWAWAKDNGTAAGGTGGGMNPERMVKMVLDAVEKARPNVSKEDQTVLTNQIVAMIDKNQAQLMSLADPSKQLTMIKGIIDSFAPKDDGTNKIFMQMLVEDRKEARAEAAELRKLMMARPEPKGFLEQLVENEAAIDKVKNLFGGGGGGKTDWGQVVMDTTSRIIEGLAPIGAAFLYRATNGAAGPAQPTPAAGTWPPKQIAAKRAVVDHQPAQAAEPAAAAATAGAPAPVEEEDAAPVPGANLTAQEQAMLMQQLAKYGTLIQQCIPFLVDHFRSGMTGYDFRDWFISRHGMNWWASMRMDLKAEGLLAAAKYDPQLWSQLQPEEKAQQFFTEFFTDQGDEDIPDSDITGGKAEGEPGNGEDE